MTIFVCDNLHPNLRGQLTKWCLQLKHNVFVTKVNSRIVEILWNKLIENNCDAIMFKSYKNEQGYLIKSIGDTKRKITNIDGIDLIIKKH